VKELRLRALSDRPGKLFLEVTGREGGVTAADIQAPPDYEIVNPGLHLATLDSADAELRVEFNVEQGRGYVPAGQSDGLPIGVIPVDAIFTPVHKVNYKVEHTRVGQASNFDRLVLEVWTDGTITAVEAISQSADILLGQLALFGQLGKPSPPVVEHGLGAGTVLTPTRYNTPIEDLQLSVRAYNCLKRSGLMMVGQVLEKAEDELLSLRNFGRKSYDELSDRLFELGFLAPEGPKEEEEAAEAPSVIEEEELSAVAAVGAPAVEEVAPREPVAPAEPVGEEVVVEEIAAPAEPEAVVATPPKRERKRAKAGEPPASAEGEEEEIPDWQRKLMALKKEVGEEGEEG
jgi:DNA-directed RNA polymerase subunit alpha